MIIEEEWNIMYELTYGGAVRTRDMMLLYPNVCTTVGKKFVTVPEATIQNSMTI